jgi:SAM-dependent methyltransferase
MMVLPKSKQAEECMTDVATSNEAQAQAWNGKDGTVWAARADFFDRAIAGYQQAFLAAADVRPGERVLDIGCGAGQTTRAAAAASGDGGVLGVDLSAQLLALARQRAADAGLANASFLQADAQIHPFADASFDVALSRNGVMFFGEPEVAFANIGRAVQPGGRLVLLVWQAAESNEWFTEWRGALAAGRTLPPPPGGAPGPFALGDPARIRSLCAVGGFAQVSVTPLSAPMRFGSDVSEAEAFALDVFGGLLEELSGAARERALDELRRSLAAHETPDGVYVGSAMWLVQAVRG